MKISIDGVERELPESVDILGEDDLYSVPFSMLSLAEGETAGTSYQWINPRRLGSIEGQTLGRGFDGQEMKDLYNDIKDEGLMFPLICRWVFKDDILSVQVLDGERRFRCIQSQVEKREKSWSRKSNAFLSAEEVYEKIPCRVVIGNDKEALKIAFMVSDRSVSWGEGATAKLIKKLRDCGCTDEEILELTKKSSQWLREMDEICQLDELTFNYLADGRINRAVALKLTKIEDIDRRHRYLTAIYEDAVANHKEELAKVEEDLEKAETKEESAEAKLVEAQIKGDEAAAEVAAVNLESARKTTKAKRAKRAESAKPQGKAKNFRNATAKIAEEENDEVPEDVAQILRPGKIRTQSDAIAELISKDGKDEDGKEVFSLDTLYVIQACYKAILAGEEDILKVLKRQRNVLKLQSMRLKLNSPPPDVVAEMNDDDTPELEEENDADDVYDDSLIESGTDL